MDDGIHIDDYSDDDGGKNWAYCDTWCPNTIVLIIEEDILYHYGKILQVTMEPGITVPYKFYRPTYHHSPMIPIYS